MKRIKRILLAVAALFVLLLVLAGVWFWHSVGKPLYQPGMVRVGANLRGSLDPPPNQDGDTFWIVEPDIRLHHFRHGEGRPVLVLHGGPGYPITKPLPGLEPLTAKFQFHYYDQRGCGQSSRPFDRFTSKNFFANMTELERRLGIGAQIADIERIRRILKQEKLVLIGHSFGAFLAAMYATEFPEHVQALVLVAPSGVLVVPGQGPNFFDEIHRRLPESRHAEYDQFLKTYLDFGRLFDKSEKELAAANRQSGDYFLLASGQSPSVRTETLPGSNGRLDGAGHVSEPRKTPRLSSCASTGERTDAGAPRGGRRCSSAGQPQLRGSIAQRETPRHEVRQDQRSGRRGARRLYRSARGFCKSSGRVSGEFEVIMKTKEKIDLYKLHKDDYVTPKKPVLLTIKRPLIWPSAGRENLEAQSSPRRLVRCTEWRSRLK